MALTPPGTLVCTRGPHAAECPAHTPFLLHFPAHPCPLPSLALSGFPHPQQGHYWVFLSLHCAGGVQSWREKLLPHPGVASLPQPHSPSPDRCAQHDALPWAHRGEQGGRVLPLWGLQWGSRQADVSCLITETARRGERLPGCEQAWGRGD